MRHPRAKRYLLRVGEDRRVRLTIPRWGSKREAVQFAEQQRAWIEQQLQRRDDARGRRPAPLDAAVEGALIARARVELPAQLLALAAKHGLTVNRVSIRNQRCRWGSCSRAGHICLNWRLVDMPAFVREYVMIHELMHLKRMDHSPAFWRLVAEACPAVKTARAWLRAQARQ